MAEAAWCVLKHHTHSNVGANAGKSVGKFDTAAVAHPLHRVWRWGKVRLNASLCLARHHHDVVAPSANCFIHHQLQSGRIKNGHQFFGHRFGGGQESGAHASGGNDSGV
jgi:hypothetical protein